MDMQTTLENTQTLLVPYTEAFTQPEANRLDAALTVDKLLPAAKTLLEQGFYLSAITGLDVPPTDEKEGQIESLYHFCKGPVVVTLRLMVPYSEPNVPSICGLIPSATLYEREMIEMFGVNLEGTISTDRLLLPDDWPDGVYPMRKSFTGLKETAKE